MMTLKFALSGALLLTSIGIGAEKRLDMRGARVIGNKELPNMLYIIPWKSIKPVEIEPPRIDSVLDEPLQALNREDFSRRVRHYNRLHNDTLANER